MGIELTPITLREARAYVAERHRHHRPPQGGIFAVAAASDGEVCGVAIVGRPVARMAADGWTAEVTRLCTDGTRNACSMLYRAAWRACRAMGYRRLITYTLPDGVAYTASMGELRYKVNDSFMLFSVYISNIRGWA